MTVRKSDELPPTFRPADRHRGFTLLEIAITVAILAVVLAAALPSLTGLVNGGRLTANANEMLGALQSARVESVRRGQRIVVCPSANGTACAANWSAGWIVFEDRDRDSNLDGNETVINSGTITPTVTVLVSPAISGSNPTNRIVFNPDGFARSAGNVLTARVAICNPTTRPADNVRDIRISAGSRVSITRRNGAGACAAIANT